MANLRIVYKEIVIDTEIKEDLANDWKDQQSRWIERVETVFKEALKMIEKYEKEETC